MIELRWYMPNGVNGNKVLQYRQLLSKFELSAILTREDAEIAKKMQEWKDVPTVFNFAS